MADTGIVAPAPATGNRWAQILPILGWLPTYQPRWFSKDLMAGLIIVAVASLFVWLYSWNEFLYARLLITNQNTLPLQVFQAIDRGSTQTMATVAAVLTLPILLVVYFLQRYLRPGALTGAVKG